LNREDAIGEAFPKGRARREEEEDNGGS